MSPPRAAASGSSCRSARRSGPCRSTCASRHCAQSRTRCAGSRGARRPRSGAGRKRCPWLPCRRPPLRRLPMPPFSWLPSDESPLPRFGGTIPGRGPPVTPDVSAGRRCLSLARGGRLAVGRLRLQRLVERLVEIAHEDELDLLAQMLGDVVDVRLVESRCDHALDPSLLSRERLLLQPA